MFEDDVYDQDPDDYYQVVAVAGGWRIVDQDEPERFKTVFADRAEAMDLCEDLNEGKRCIYQRDYRDERYDD
jgi:N-acyl-L-homoserine lactone synthetase